MQGATRNPSTGASESNRELQTGIGASPEKKVCFVCWGKIAAAIKNYDCVVKTEKVFVPIEENRDADGGHYLDEVERLIFNDDKQIEF